MKSDSKALFCVGRTIPGERILSWNPHFKKNIDKIVTEILKHLEVRSTEK